MHHCTAAHVASVPVRDTFRGQVAWEGVVEVFDLTGYPGAKRIYAWSYPDGKETRFTTVLEVPPVDSAVAAVRASVMAQRDV
jgi:hypothetical protein